MDATESGKISGLKIEQFGGSRNPTVYEDWKTSVEKIRFVSDLPPPKLAMVASMSLVGEAKSLTRHITLEQLKDEAKAVVERQEAQARIVSEALERAAQEMDEEELSEETSLEKSEDEDELVEEEEWVLLQMLW